jgi:hypothetical protein
VISSGYAPAPRLHRGNGMGRTSYTAILVVLLAGLSFGVAAAETRFSVPRIVVVEVSPSRGEVVIFDETTSRHARLSVGQRHADTYRLVGVDADRVVLRRMGSDIYYVLPAGDANRGDAARYPGERARSASHLAPVNPYDHDDHRQASGHEQASETRGVLDPFAYSARANRARYDRHREHRRDDDRRHDDHRAPSGHHSQQPSQQPINPFDLEARDGAPRDPDDQRGQPERREPRGNSLMNPFEAEREAPPASEGARAEPISLSRSRLDATLADFRGLERQIWIRAEGSAVRITSLETGSPIYQLGLRQGDLVQRIAGRQLDSVEAAAALYAHLARVDTFSVELLRGDRPLVLHYRLTD